jgi:Glycosyl hydrolase family 115/Gylcosyl hydrolase family 115 C-terminal domain
MATLAASPSNAVRCPDALRARRRPVARVLLGSLVACLGMSPAALALGGKPFVASAASRGSFPLVARGVAAPIVVDTQDHAGVLRAARDLQQDVERVTGLRPALVEGTAPRGPAVLVGTLGRSALVERLVQQGKLDVREIRGRWESSLIQVVERPWPGAERVLVVAGSDKRGTIFGVYDVSEEIGVSPWYWWADVPVRHREALHVEAGRHVRAEPKVRYRGIFLNDEAPALSGWTHEKLGGFNHQLYTKVFELLLRLRANFLWPAMWGNAFADDDPTNPKLADEYGIVIGTSHHEPMMRAHDEWRRYGKGPWNYATNPDVLRAFWTEGIRRVAPYEKIVTLAMRGDGDEPMSEEANVALLQRIVADQRKILADETKRDVTTIPQVWALYKEVQEYYEKGMRVPDDVTLLWCDDNWGNIRRLPTAEERKRAGGAGMYYHFDYVGGPRSYKWLNTIPIPKIWEQMHLAWRYGADRIWVVNVGDLKPMEVPIQFFLDYAWDPGALPADSLESYLRAWAEREFGASHAGEIAEIVAAYTRFNGRRKPEMLEPRTYSLVNYREAETVVADYNALAGKAQALYERLPKEGRDAFFQLVLYPVKACAALNELYVTVGRNHLYAVQGRTSTNDLAARARELFREDAALSREYNDTLAGGKWHHMMDQTHIGYTYWNQPVRNAMPGVQEIQPSAEADMGVAIEGSDGSWPGGGGRDPALPALDVYDKGARYVEVFNRGLAPFEFTTQTSDAWLRVDPASGSVDRDQRVWVSADWSAAPRGTVSGSLVINGPQGTKVAVKVPLRNPEAPRLDELHGFVESDGYVSVEAEHFTRAAAPAGRSWLRIPGHGRTLSGMTTLPVTASSLTPGPQGQWLEYAIHFFSAGTFSVDAYLAPTQKLQPGPGLRYAVSFDDETPQVLNVNADTSLAAWEKTVADGVTVLRSKHVLAKPGPHVLKFWALDPALVLQKLVVDTGALRPSYLGPPESVHR